MRSKRIYCGMEPAGPEAPRAGAPRRIGRTSVSVSVSVLAAAVAAVLVAGVVTAQQGGAAADGAAPVEPGSGLAAPELDAPDAPDLPASEPAAADLATYGPEASGAIPDLATGGITTIDLTVPDLPVPDAAPSLGAGPAAAAAGSPLLLWLGLSAALSWGATLYLYRRWGRAGSARRHVAGHGTSRRAGEARSIPAVSPEARLIAAAGDLALAAGRLTAIADKLEQRHALDTAPSPDPSSPARGARRRFAFLDAGATDDGGADAAEPRGLFELESARAFADQEPGPRRARRAKSSPGAKRRRPAPALARAEALEMTALGIGDAEASEYGG